jgi:peptidoglycan/LPS O-acetylase OafA/YrhL
MANSIFHHRRMRQAVALFLLSGSFFCVFPADNPLCLYWAKNAEMVCLGYLALGLLFFLTNHKRLMFVSMGCCAAMCLYFWEIAPRQWQQSREAIEQPVSDSLQEKNRPEL